MSHRRQPDRERRAALLGREVNDYLFDQADATVTGLASRAGSLRGAPGVLRDPRIGEPVIDEVGADGWVPLFVVLAPRSSSASRCASGSQRGSAKSLVRDTLPRRVRGRRDYPRTVAGKMMGSHETDPDPCTGRPGR